MAYIYKHIRKDTNEIFYIGIGKLKRRLHSTKNRNAHWKHIVDKCGFISEIIEDNLSWEEACEKEKLLIKQYGRIDLGTGVLVNMTEGGEGFVSNHSDISKIKMSIAKSGKKRQPHSTKTKEKIASALTGIIRSQKSKEKNKISHIGKKASENTREKMKESKLGIKHSDSTIQKMKKPKSKEHAKNISKGRMGIIFSKEHKDNLSKSHIGQCNWNKGGKLSNDVKDKISKTLLGNSNAKRIAVFQYDLNGIFIKKWDKLIDIKRELGFNTAKISKCVKGEQNIANGFIWKNQ